MAGLRQIVLDTETTGLDPYKGDHRLVEIGCLELVDYLPTGKVYHQYINPERSVPEAAAEVHGLREDFLKNHPVFRDVYKDFLEFIGESELVIHNARFDMKFLNAELDWVKHPQLPMDRAIDTLAIARKKFPGSPASLDALCKRFGVDNSNRDLHGALLDSELLAEVYLQLIGGRQPGLNLDQKKAPSEQVKKETVSLKREHRAPRNLYTLSPEEEKAHQALMDEIIKKAG